MIINKLPRGGGKIKDATALPTDVRKGKIFYNNEGKQAGTGDFKQVRQLLVTKGNEIDIGLFLIIKCKFNYVNCTLNGVEANGQIPITLPTKANATFGRNVKKIIGLTIRGVYYDVLIDLNYTEASYCFTPDTSKKGFAIFSYEKYDPDLNFIYFENLDYADAVIIHYID